jgi:class 3 adenylate cyclase
MREERRVVTAMFADLVGSTTLAERLDPEDFKLIVADALARVIGAVEGFGGTIKDLAGDGVLALFGAPVAHEDDPERAVRAGMRAVEEIAAYAHEVEAAFGVEGLALRVGVNTGPVVVGAIGTGSRVEYSALGDAVNVAARLQARAEPGSVLVGEETRRRIITAFEWGEPRTLELKGKDRPVVASAVLGAAAHPGPSRGPEGIQARLVGRERELSLGAEVVDAVLAGGGGILVVSGEPGIGKTRLVAELRGRFETSPAGHGRALWLEGRCVSYGESMPYWPFRDLVRSWLGASADDPELRVRLRLRREVERLFGDSVDECYPYLGSLLGLTLESEAQERLAELSPESLQYRIFEVVRILVARLAEDGPVGLLIEDLHWADATSLQLLERLLPETESSALALVLTMRSERDLPAWRLKDEALRELPHRAREVALEALSGDARSELLDALVGGDTLPSEMRPRPRARAPGALWLPGRARARRDGGLARDPSCDRRVVVFGVRAERLRPDVVVAGRGGDAGRRTPRHREDPDHGVVPGLRRPRVLPAPAVPVRQPHERGRVQPSAVRRADRTRAAGAERPRAPRAVPRGRPDGRRRPRGVHTARLRAQRCVRESVGPGMVGVRQVVVELRGPRGGSELTARLTRPHEIDALSLGASYPFFSA